MDVNKASALVFFIVTVLGAVSLIVLLSDTAGTGHAISPAPKTPLGVMTEKSDCKLPLSTADLISFLSERKNVAFSMDSCHLIAQDFCVVLNSGSCLRQCLQVVQSPDGVCGSSSSGGITAQVVLTPEECKRLALSYDISNVNFLRTVGAGTQSTDAVNPCSGGSDVAAAKVYSVDNPLQAYARNVFPEGDVTGYVVDSEADQSALEYVICKDGRARVNIEGQSRCSSL